MAEAWMEPGCAGRGDKKMRAGLENLQAESEHRSVCRFLLSVASPLIVFQGFDCFIGHREKGDQVEDRHQTDTDVPRSQTKV